MNKDVEYTALRNELNDLWKYCINIQYVGYAFVISLLYFSIFRPILDTISSIQDIKYTLYFNICSSIVIIGQIASFSLIHVYKSYTNSIFRVGGYITIFHEYYDSTIKDFKNNGWHFWNRVESSSKVRETIKLDTKFRMAFKPVSIDPFIMLVLLSFLPFFIPFWIALLNEQCLSIFTQLLSNSFYWYIPAILLFIFNWIYLVNFQKNISNYTERWIKVWSKIRNDPKESENLINMIEAMKNE